MAVAYKYLTGATTGPTDSSLLWARPMKLSNRREVGTLIFKMVTTSDYTKMVLGSYSVPTMAVAKMPSTGFAVSK